MEREVNIIDSISERIEGEGFDALTDPERYYWAIWWLEGEVNNGTFEQYFHNSSGELAHEALQGLKAVGARQMAAIFQTAIDLFPNSQVPKNREKRNQILDEFTPSQEVKLEKLSHAFTNYPDDLPFLLETYVKDHEEYFLGPRTLLEQWNARRARGADTHPQVVSEWDLDKEAAKDAQFTDRKCPICGQPAPNYRKTCKRCGYPYGRDIEQS
jgi:hypothetical protein